MLMLVVLNFLSSIILKSNEIDWSQTLEPKTLTQTLDTKLSLVHTQVMVGLS